MTIEDAKNIVQYIAKLAHWLSDSLRSFPAYQDTNKRQDETKRIRSTKDDNKGPTGNSMGEPNALHNRAS